MIKLNCSVFIAGSGRSLAFLKDEFQECTFIDLPSYRFFYSGMGLMSMAMMLSSPLILWGILNEHKLLSKIIRRHGIHAVISDNRFGLWNSEIPCVYLTHQVKIKTSPYLKYLEPILFKIHRYFIKKYDILWIPDSDEAPTLSGDLAHGFGDDIAHRYIGPLSRFTSSEKNTNDIHDEEKPDILAIISGPEPQRILFEMMIIEQAALVSKRIVLLQGIPGKGTQPVVKGNLTIYPHLETNKLERIIRSAGIVLCRPGYSSIMDLAVLGKKAFFVPTPGQTEQEYLAAYLRDQGICNFASQKDFSLADIDDQISRFRGFEGFGNKTEIEQALENFVEYICSTF